MQTADFHYDLPAELIARYPLPERSASRLLCLNGNTGAISHQKFVDLVGFLKAGDLLVVNNSKVIPARLWGVKTTGGQVEMLVDRILDTQRIVAHVRASKTPREGSYLLFGDARFEVLGRQQDLFELRCDDTRPVLEVIEALGQIPLPPYFQREPEVIKRFMQNIKVQWQRRRRVCILMKRYCHACVRKVSLLQMSPYM
jgi:S-adenosylmethionine:tRNA ribosyltransferase-isomerase